MASEQSAVGASSGGQCCWPCIASTSPLTLVAEIEVDEIKLAYMKTLPLADPRAYWRLVALVYRGSGALIFGNMLEWLDFGVYGYSEGEISAALFGGSSTIGWLSFGLGCNPPPVEPGSVGLTLSAKHGRRCL